MVEERRKRSPAAFSSRQYPQRTPLSGKEPVLADSGLAGGIDTPPVLTSPAALLDGRFEHSLRLDSREKG